ncbi:SRPBCC family protein [Streptomyces sp. SAI-041]|uniref:SRPBCC family protein n=1 Tax=Streptomyces sp. SAI-041 TaxID=2940548 RepID=UPI002476FD53|nr:SRPBCC family protein [Streptomyces sp. SAI-041]MDH6546790.1 uncharacterized protein YndB with AHSA1/START domain [Streptomyces sp. SAI-041]
MAADLTGTYLTLDDGRSAVRFSRTYDHPVARVWQFVTDADELAHWFPSRAEIELRPGGTVKFSGDPHMEDSTGRVVAVDAPRHLSFAWGGDEVHFDLEALDEKRTRFTLTNVLGATDSAARNGAGWEVCLASLDARAGGRHREEPHWKELYQAYVDAGVPSGAPVPGTD